MKIKIQYKLYRTRFQGKRRAMFSYLFDKISSIFIKNKPIKITNPKKILIIRNDHIGDVVLCSHVYREIKKKIPDCKIIALVSPITKPLLEKNKNIDKIFVLGLFWRKLNIKSLRQYFKFLKKIKKEKFDVGIDIRGSLINIILFLWLPRIKKRAGYFNLNGGIAFLTNPFLYRKIEHTTKYDMDLVGKALGIKPENYFPEIVTDKKDKEKINKFIREHKLKKYICICPGATNKSKQWNQYKFDKLIKQISKKYPKHKIILIGGKEDEKLINWLNNKNKKCLKLINFNLRLLSLLFKKSQLVIANDGGPMHIAWVSEANLIALWGLKGYHQLTLMRPLKKSIILHHLEKRKNIQNPTDLITVEEVKKTMEKILNKK